MKKRKFLFLLLLSVAFCGITSSAFSNDRNKMADFKERFAAANHFLPTPILTEADAAVYKGRVVDTLGNGMIGVSITVEGSNIKTVTGEGGYFQVETDLSNPVIIFTHTGYEEVRYPIMGPGEILITMRVVNSGMSEVVVVGFGKQKRSDMIGSVSSVNPSELKVPSSNLTTALVGRVAGLIGFQRSGEPGQDNANFFIRGVTTFGYKVDPLILIDNVEASTTDLARLQVDDIASFSIMKDATATAIYGARGANGVILITTKEGKLGKPSVAIRYERSMSEPTSEVTLADPITYMRLHNEAVLTRGGYDLPYSYKDIDKRIKGESPILYPTTDWMNTLLKDRAATQRFNLNVSGGGDIARYFVSGAFNQDNGILNVPKVSNFNNNINLKTYSLRANVNIDLTKSTELLVRLNGSFDDYTGPLKGGAQVYRDIMRTNPVLFPAYYEPGEEYKYVNHIMFGNFNEGNYLNPYADMVKGYRQYSRSMMLAQLELRQKLDFVTPGLAFRIMGNTTRNSFFSINRDYKPFYYMPAPGSVTNTGDYKLAVINEMGGSETIEYRESEKSLSSLFYLESALTYNRLFDQKHSVSGLLVGIMQNRLYGNPGSLQLSLPFRNLGASGRFTYGYDSRYYVELNFGYNGSERFHKSKRFGFFPSAGLAWSVSNEKFWESIKPVISTLRLRGTYGIVGNDAIGADADRFYYLSEVNMTAADRTVSFGTDRGQSYPGILVRRYGNNAITWEQAHKTNLALELGLFNKFKLTVDAFHEKRKNIFMARQNMNPTMGLGSVIVSGNVGEAMGKGVDFTLEYSKNFQSGFWIQSRGTFTYAHSEYIKNEEPNYAATPWLSRIGQPIYSTYGLVASRLFVDDAEVANSPEQMFGEARGGDIKYVDINNDGKINSLDYMNIGYPTIPEINYGFGFSIGYKGVDLSAYFQGLARESFFINPQLVSPFTRVKYAGEDNDAVVLQNQLLQEIADSRWSEQNQDLYAFWPRLTTTPGGNNYQTSTWWMRNGAFLRLKQVDIGYSFPQSVLSRIKMKTLRIYASGTNLLLFSKFKLWDVEMAGNGLEYPLQRVYNLGLQINF